MRKYILLSITILLSLGVVTAITWVVAWEGMPSSRRRSARSFPRCIQSSSLCCLAIGAVCRRYSLPGIGSRQEWASATKPHPLLYSRKGAVAGGGTGLLTALPALDEVPGGSSEMQVGIRVLRRALEEPLRRNVRKVGRKGEEVVA
jgi:hypothetical protein